MNHVDMQCLSRLRVRTFEEMTPHQHPPIILLSMTIIGAASTQNYAAQSNED